MYTRAPYQMSNLSSGYCMWCKVWKNDNSDIILKDNKIILFKNKSQESFYKVPFSACANCRKDLFQLGVAINPDKETAPIIANKEFEMISKDKNLSELNKATIRHFLRFLTIFPGQIDGVFLIPRESFDDNSGFEDKMNLMLDIKGFRTMAFVPWASREDKTILDLWNTGIRGRFWSVKITRLLIALGVLDAKSKFTRVWIKSGNSAISIRTFVSHPPTMIRCKLNTILKISE